MSAHTAEYETILTLVRSWSATQRLTLVQDILVTLTPPDDTPRTTLQRARGLLASGQTPPTDQQVAAWRDERRAERYGL